MHHVLVYHALMNGLLEIGNNVLVWMKNWNGQSLQTFKEQQFLNHKFKFFKKSFENLSLILEMLL
jgi:hypothetical protein